MAVDPAPSPDAVDDGPGGPGGLWFRSGLILVVLLAAVAAAIVLAVNRDTDVPRLVPCSEAGGRGHATLLFDATKPLESAALPALRDIGRQVPAGGELRVHGLVNAAGPRFLGALCRPYQTDALNVSAAKDGHDAMRDCDDLPAQLAPDLRTAAARYCAERADLAARLDALAGRERRVEGAYLIEALGRLLRGPETPDALFVVSDMLQHAAWYSHLDLDWTEWGFDHFQIAARAHGLPIDPAQRPRMRIRVLYVPRRGITDDAQIREVHWSFWRAFFRASGASGGALEFDERDIAASYLATARMDLGAALAAVARQRNATRRELSDASIELKATLDEIAALTAQNRPGSLP